jgi:hypothetical protein
MHAGANPILGTETKREPSPERAIRGLPTNERVNFDPPAGETKENDMPRVKGFLRIIKRRRPGAPVDPDYGIDEGVDPDYGIDEGAGIDNELPEPPPGIWPPLTPEQPWRPIGGRPPHVGGGPARPPVAGGRPDQGLPGEPEEELPPGSIWPPLPPGVHGKFLALVLIGATGHGAHYRYVVIDADALPELPETLPEHPPGVPQPKR